jgi:hypothetical protein
VVKTKPKVTKNFPFQPSFAVGHVLSLEMSDLGTEDGPDAQILKKSNKSMLTNM